MGGCACDKGFIGLGAVPRDPRSLRPLKTTKPRQSREMILQNKEQYKAAAEKPAVSKPDESKPAKLSRALLVNRKH